MTGKRAETAQFRPQPGHPLQLRRFRRQPHHLQAFACGLQEDFKISPKNLLINPK